MDLSDDAIEKIAERIFQKLLSKQESYEDEKDDGIVEESYIVTDEFGNARTINKKQFLLYEIENLKLTQIKFEEEENYESAEIIRLKIIELKKQLNSIK
jgi:hypothetical protein